MLLKLFLLVVFLFSAVLTRGQKTVYHQKQVWYKYYLKIPIGDDWQVRQELDDRNFVDPGRQSQFLCRTHIQRNFGKGWDAALGFAFFVHSLPQDPEVRDFNNENELRPSFEIANLHSLSNRFHLHHRYWTEARFFDQPDDGYVFSNFRLRYKIELGYILSEHFRFLVYDEIQINAGRKITYNVFDQNRYGIAAMYSPVKNIGLEIMYINWFQQLPSGDAFYNRDNIRIALHHTLTCFQKKELN